MVLFSLMNHHLRFFLLWNFDFRTIGRTKRKIFKKMCLKHKKKSHSSLLLWTKLKAVKRQNILTESRGLKKCLFLLSASAPMHNYLQHATFICSTILHFPRISEFWKKKKETHLLNEVINVKNHTTNFNLCILGWILKFQECIYKNSINATEI